MKKILTTTLFIISLLFLFACNKVEHDKTDYIHTGNITCDNIVVKDYYSNNTHFKVFTNNKGGIFVINLTKDSILINSHE